MNSLDKQYEDQALALGWFFDKTVKKWRHPEFKNSGCTKAKYAVEDHDGWIR